jgi:cell division protein FtsB
MFNPAYVLPTFLAVCCAGLVIWNVRLTGDVEKLDTYLDAALADNDTLAEQVEKLALEKELLEVLLDQKNTSLRGYQQDVDAFREERAIQEAKIDGLQAENNDYVQMIIDRNREITSLQNEIKGLVASVYKLSAKVPKRDESGKFKKKSK